MNGMYEELIDKLRKNNRMSGWTHIDRLMDDAIKAIEALRQENNGWQERYYELDAGHSRLFKDFCKLQKENEQLRVKLADWKYNAKCDADHIAALTADKDEQTEQMKYLLRRTLPILEVTNDQQELIDAINALLGGKEDA